MAVPILVVLGPRLQGEDHQPAGVGHGRWPGEPQMKLAINQFGNLHAEWE